MEQRHRIGEAGGFDDDASRPIRLAPGERPHGLDEIIAGRAAEAAIGEQHDITRVEGLSEDGIVDADLAELVDDDGRAGHAGLLQKCGDERGLAAAEKAGDDRYRYPFRGHLLATEPAPVNGAQGRNRTSDTRIFNPLLYQLSYLGSLLRGMRKSAPAERRGLY